PPRERGKFSGLFGAVFGLASVLGPVIGGYFTDHGTVHLGGHVVAGWRWVFYVNLPLSLLSLFTLVALLFSFNPDLLAEMLPISDAVEAVSKDGPLFAGALAAWALLLGGWMVIVERLRKIFATLTAGDPFHPDNVLRLRVVGLILAGLEVGRYVFSGMARLLAPKAKVIDDSFTLTAWFSVLVVFVLAEVFREGARLRREAELTI
ncbi:MAG: MFS transporter, partial [Alphaproteobacteria bacterium]|nr:MFS transporter [Alphaproteobacteria bacterium]